MRAWISTALALAACAAIATLVMVPKSEPPASPTQVAQAKPIPEVPIEKLPIRVDASSLLATRGAGSASQPSGPELVRGLSKYQNDDYSGAATQLKGLAQKYPDDGTIRLYLGVSELFLKQDHEAADDLTVATKHLEGGRLSDSRWYLAVANLRLGQRDAAVALFHELCAGKNAYLEQACKLESQLK